MVGWVEMMVGRRNWQGKGCDAWLKMCDSSVML